MEGTGSLEEARKVFSNEYYLQRQYNAGRPLRNRYRTRNPQYQMSKSGNLKSNITGIRRKSAPLLPDCVFDGPFLSACYNRRPVCKSDEIACKTDSVFCCYKPLCDILPTSQPVIQPVAQSNSGSTSVISPSVNDCELRANYILVCTEPKKFPQCPYDVNGDISMCKMRKPYTSTYALCCYKEMGPILSNSSQKIASSNTTNISPNVTVLQECSVLG